jgi:hypothetical protein
MREWTTYTFSIEGVSPILMHKFNGQEEEKRISELPHAEQAEYHAYHAYRTAEGNLGIPNTWIRGCLIDTFIDAAPSKAKQKTKQRVSPRIRVEPMMLTIEPQTHEVSEVQMQIGCLPYDIQVDNIPTPKTGRGGTRQIVVRPLIRKWKTTGKLITGLDESREMEKWLAQAGEEIGIGANRINGYGRFKVTAFKQ